MSDRFTPTRLFHVHESATFINMAVGVRATYVSLTTGDAIAVYGRSLDRKLSEKWVFPWFSRLKSAFIGHAG